jgi:subtilisin family serine protease
VHEVTGHKWDASQRALPAWSLPKDAVERIALPAEWPERVTREWAFGGSTGKGARVCILDSGIDPNHPSVGALESAVVISLGDDEEAVADEDTEGDVSGHGTACAGIIRKLAPNAELYSVRVLGERLTGKGIVFAAGLRWCIENEMQVVNLSLSTPKRDYFGLFHEIADEAYFRNVMLVCAVNNVPKPSYPSQYSSVFSVAAHEGKDPFAFDYNPSPPVEFGAPGIDLEVAWLDGSTLQATGNSFAAPHVAGAIARILSKHPQLTPFQMKTVLAALAVNAQREGRQQ